MELRLTAMEKESYDLKNIQLELIESLKEAEAQNDLAEEKIQDLLRIIEELEQFQAVYIPKRLDPVDQSLANYINNYPEKKKLQIMFLRESEGVYQFGQRRVYVKVEKGNQILVRVGGGFMHIDDFIEQYTDSEVAKIERHNVVERF